MPVQKLDELDERLRKIEEDLAADKIFLDNIEKLDKLDEK